MPEWVRRPKTRPQCPYGGLSRSPMNELLIPKRENNPPLRSRAEASNHLRETQDLAEVFVVKHLPL